ncbi:streptolysin S family TOMM toxin [Clostridium oceanicum]|uniref:Bacteriocin protoxin, streptolysin S family n=1 Tax=Clostridium oceanicum TaxID=1543 RepID=A0ABP3UH70_9CLOT
MTNKNSQLLNVNAHLSNTCSSNEQVTVAPGGCCCTCCCCCCVSVNVGSGSSSTQGGA